MQHQIDDNTLKRKAHEHAIASNNKLSNTNVNTAGETSLPTPPLRGIVTTCPAIAASGSDANTTAIITTARTTYSGSNNNNNPTAAAAAAWSDLVINNEFAKPSECGTYIDCTACSGRGFNKGRVPSRDGREFADRRWIEHMGNKGHKQAVQNIKVEREKNNPMGRKNQISMSAYFGAKKKKDKISSTSTVAAGHSSISRLLSCAGAYNALSGKNKVVVSIYCKYIAPLTTQPFHVGKYKSLPAIVSNDCTKFGIFNGLDGGMVCATCKELRTMKGPKDPATLMKR